MSNNITNINKNVDNKFNYPYCDDVFEKYEKVCRIGKGTFGEVFRARHKLTKKEVALKRILMDNENEGFPITAIREIKLLRSYKDENVVNLIEVCRSTPEINGKATSYLVFDFCHHDLAGLIQEAHDKIKPLPVIKCIVTQLLEGLLKLHTNKIIHRDMKSSNILITKDGELKIADFGLARPYSNNVNDRKYTNRVVTLWYRPPELLLGERNYACAVDIWGVGCIMSELFTKEPLMKGSTEQHQLQLIADNIGPISPEVWPSVVDLPLYPRLSNAINNGKQRKLLMVKMKRFTHNENALDLLKKLLLLDPTRRIDANDALDHDFFWDDRDPLPNERKAVLAKALSSISQSQFEYTARHRRTQNPVANQNNYVAQQMVNRSNNHRPMGHGHRPGPSNNDGQYRDHIY